MERAELMRLLRVTGVAEECDGGFFLCDPRWGAAEREQVRRLQQLRAEDGANEGWVCVPTGGTSGGIKFARHDERTLLAAARGFAEHFGIRKVNAVDVLPPFHVSGLMARVRCAVSGGTHVAWEWKRLERGERPVVNEDEPWVISLVPTQLQRLLAVRESAEWLRRFGVVLIGGAAAWKELLDAAAEKRVRVALSYGMTETAAMVAAQRPEEFLSGDRSSGTAMPHAQIACGEDGTIAIEGASLFRGYWPEWRTERRFETSDEGEIDASGRLHVRGRRDAVIITGGEKVNPLEVEAGLRASGQFDDVAVVGVPDAEWGTAVVACYARGERAIDWCAVERELAGLAGFKRPKRFVAVEAWPRNAQGKVNRAELVRRASTASTVSEPGGEGGR